MAKKLLALILALCLPCGILAGCGKKTPQGTNAAPTATAAPTTEPAAPNPLDDPNHPANDDTLSILMVGNSFCYYYVEELYGLLMANPNRVYEKVQVWNLYYSGCSLSQHYSWWQTGTPNYQLFKTDESGRVELEPSKQWTLEAALRQGKWDYISLQGTVQGGSYATGNLSELRVLMTPLAEALLGYFHQEHPYAQLLWHRTWPYEEGRISGSTTYDTALLEKYNAGMQEICDWMTTEFDKDKDYDLIQVNSGAAWPIARAENAKLETSLIPEEGGLSARLGVRNEKTFPYFPANPNAGDGYHEGDIGGGQFLNACVWYETITGESCLDNPYKPTKGNGKYELSDEFASLLRNAAHSVNN